VELNIKYLLNRKFKIGPKKNNFNPLSRHKDPSQLVTCEITCSVTHYCQGQRYAGQMSYIVLYSLLFILGTILITNSISLGVSIGFATISNPDIFGQQRVYGTVGFGIAAFGASRVYEFFKIDLVYIIMFSITSILCIIVTSFIRIRTNKTTANHEKELDDLSVEKTKKKKKKKSESRLSTLVPLFKNIDVIVFLSLTLVWGMSYAGLDPYLYLYIDEFAACKSHSIVGWMSLTSATAEVIGFFVAAKLLKLLGTNPASIIILLAFAIRFAGYYFITRPYFLIPMETMHFFNFGILYILISQKADSIAPPGLAGTLQGIALGIAFGLGRGVGLVIASFIYTTFEKRRLFLVIALFNLSAAVIYSIYFLLTQRRSKKSIEKNDQDDAKSKIEPLLVVSTNNKPMDEQ
jgi:phosphate/sulfate permease